jgi:hypothetical protein
MSKEWIYRNGETPFSVTEIKLPDEDTVLLSVSKMGVIRNHFSSGNEIFSEDNQHYLIPYEPYSDFKIDDEVYVYDDDDGDEFTKEAAHFAGIDKEGNPTAFRNGGTSFTRNPSEIDSWDHCEKANKEDK